VERLVDAYDFERGRATRDLGIAQGQLRDFEARLGARFAHESYLDELTSLRNQRSSACPERSPLTALSCVLWRSGARIPSNPPRSVLSVRHRPRSR
jgi:hypothetical protein